MTKAANVTLQFVFLTEEGDEGEEEDQTRQTRGEKEADLIGQAEVPEDLIGQAEATTGLIDCRVVMGTPSEEVVTHHLDELWHLGPGGTVRKKLKEFKHPIAHTNTKKEKMCLLEWQSPNSGP